MSVKEVKQRWFRAIDPEDYRQMQSRAIKKAQNLTGESKLRSTTVLHHERTLLQAIFGQQGQQEIVDVNALSKDELQSATLETRVHDMHGRQVARVGYDAKTDSRRAEADIATKADFEGPAVTPKHTMPTPPVEPEDRKHPHTEPEIPNEIRPKDTPMTFDNENSAPIIARKEPELSAQIYAADTGGKLEELRAAMPMVFNIEAAANINTPRHDEGAATHDVAAVRSVDTEGSATRGSFKNAVLMDAEEIRAEIVASQNRTRDIVMAPAA